MKLEVGMYVRTKEGHICKIKSITRNTSLGEETIEARFICENNNIYDYDKYDTSNDIKGKPSHNIIDLIEVGDIVVSLNASNILEYNLLTLSNIDELKDLWNIQGNIKSIVTKEQFENMSYKVD